MKTKCFITHGHENDRFVMPIKSRFRFHFPKCLLKTEDVSKVKPVTENKDTVEMKQIKANEK